MPPRTLNAPVGVWFSCFTHTSHPVRQARRGQAYCGVGGTVRRTSWEAVSNSSRQNSGRGALMETFRQVDVGKNLARSRVPRFHVLDLNVRQQTLRPLPPGTLGITTKP